MVIGIGLIVGGGILEVMWLGFLFGSVLGIVLVLIFARHLLVMPWTIGMAAGMACIASTDKETLSSGVEDAKKVSAKFLRLFLKFIKISAVVFVLVLLGAGGYRLYEKNEQENLEKKIAQERQEKIKTKLQERQLEIYRAKERNAEWIFWGEVDPASGKKIARTASITSEDGLCELTVQKRINGSQLTGLDCIGVTIPPNEDVNINFDTQNFSRTMDIDNYTDSDDVYIRSYQSDYLGHMSYESFTTGLLANNKVAIKIPIDDSFWAHFTLNRSSNAINSLGREIK